MSRIATDVMLFSQHNARLVLCVQWQSTAPIASWFLHGEALWLHPPGLCRCPLSRQTWPRFQFRVYFYTYSCTLGPAHRTPDSAPPVRKSAHATAIVTSVARASAGAPALTEDPLSLQIPDASVPMAPATGPVPLDLPMPTLPVPLPPVIQFNTDPSQLAQLTQVIGIGSPRLRRILCHLASISVPCGAFC